MAVLANGHFRTLVEASGLDFVELGRIDAQIKTMRHPHLYDQRKGFDVFFRGLIRPIIRPTLQEISARHRPARTVVLASRFAFGARLAREKLHMPVITLALTPHALASGRKVSFFSPDGVIGLFPAWFAATKPSWPPHVRLTGFPLDSPATSAPMPPVLETFLASGDSPVIFTPGTAMRHADRFFRESMKACLQAGLRGVFVTPFDETDPGENAFQHPSRPVGPLLGGLLCSRAKAVCPFRRHRHLGGSKRWPAETRNCLLLALWCQ